MKRAAFGLSCWTLLFFAVEARAGQWVALNNGNSNACEVACVRHDMTAVLSGTSADGSPYGFCIANHNDEGYRGGYNTPANGCSVAWGGAEHRSEADPLCLCSSRQREFSWVWAEPSDGPSCAYVCGRTGQAALVTGTDAQGEKFFACAANAGNEGFRGGYNKKSKVCVVPWGGKPVEAYDFKCLCLNS